MNHPLLLVAFQELTVARRNRWVLSFAALFAALTLAIAYFGMVTSGYSGAQDFIRTAASIVGVAGFLLPLFALLLGVFSFSSDHAYLDLITTQPISRSQVVLGKYLGLLLTLLAATVVGFGLPGVLVALGAGSEGAGAYVQVVGLGMLLGAVFLGIAVLIAVAARRRPYALGVAIGVWIFFELLYGLLMLGSTLVLSSRTLEVVLIGGLLGNPIDLVRVVSLIVVGGPELFGPGGATLIDLAGEPWVASLVALSTLSVWLVAPPVVAGWLFSRQDL